MAGSRSPRTAFTLIELLVVIAIIMVLMGLLIPTLGIIRERQMRLDTEVRIDSLMQAVDHYLAGARFFGRPAEDLDAAGNVLAPMRHLFHDLPPQEVMLQLTTSLSIRDASGSLDGPWIDCAPAEATHMRNGFGGPILFQVTLEDIPDTTARRLRYLIIRSENGDVGDEPGVLDDDSVFRLDTKKGKWRRVRIVEVDPTGVWQIEDR